MTLGPVADHLHPALDIPGAGLWEGARIHHRNGWSGVVLEDCRGQEHVGAVLDDGEGDTWLDEPAVACLSLRLDDPLGLGLAGLTARVAERLGWDRQLVSVLLPFAVWAPPRWADMTSDAVLREAATLLARLDRLAAAVDPTYTVRPGVVPEWRRLGDEAWILTITQPSGRTISARFAARAPDPIGAAGTVLEVCGG